MKKQAVTIAVTKNFGVGKESGYKEYSKYRLFCKWGLLTWISKETTNDSLKESRKLNSIN